MAKIVPDNPFAFPPSMDICVALITCMHVGIAMTVVLFIFNKSPAQLSSLTQNELKLHLSAEVDIN